MISQLLCIGGTWMIAYFIGLLGMWVFADGVSSLWAYLPHKEETFWRNHSFRIVRCLVGIALMIIGVALVARNL